MAGNIEQIEWFLAREGQQFGPLSDSELKKIIDLGHLKPDDLLWRAGMEEWEKSENIFPPPAPPKPIFSAPPKPVFKDPNAPAPGEPPADEPSADVSTSEAEPSNGSSSDQAEPSSDSARDDDDQTLTDVADSEAAKGEANNALNTAGEPADKTEDEAAVESVEDILETIAIDGDGRQDVDAKTDEAVKDDTVIDQNTSAGTGSTSKADKAQPDQPANAVNDDKTSAVTAGDNTESSAKIANGSGEPIDGDNETSAAKPIENESAATGDSAQDAVSAHSEQSGDETGDNGEKAEKLDKSDSQLKSKFKLTSKLKSKVTPNADQDPDQKNARVENSAAQDQSQSAGSSPGQPKAQTDTETKSETAAKSENDTDAKTGSDLERNIEQKIGTVAGKAADQSDASSSPATKKSRFSFARSLSMFRRSEPAIANTDAGSHAEKNAKTSSSNNNAPDAASADAADISTADQDRAAKRDKQKREKDENNTLKKAALKRTERGGKSVDVTEHQSPASRQRGAHNKQRLRAAKIPEKGTRPTVVPAGETTSAAPVASGAVSAAPVASGAVSCGAVSRGDVSRGDVSNWTSSTGRAASANHGQIASQSSQASLGSKVNHSPNRQRTASNHGQPADPAIERAAANWQNASPHRRRQQHGDQHRASTAAASAAAAQQQNGTASHTVPHAQTPTNVPPAHSAPLSKAAPAPVLNSIAVRQASRIPASPAELNASAPAPTAPRKSLSAGQIAPGRAAQSTAQRASAAQRNPASGQIARGQAAPGHKTPGQASHRPHAQRHGVLGQSSLPGQAAAAQVMPGQGAGQVAAGQAATGQAVPPYIAGANQMGQQSIGALPVPKRKRRRIVLPLLLVSAIGGAGWLNYTGQIELPEQVKHYYAKAITIGKSLVVSYIPESGSTPDSTATKSTTATNNDQALSAKKSLQVVLNKQPTAAAQLTVPQAVTLPGALNAASEGAGTGPIVILPQGQTQPETSPALLAPGTAQSPLDNTASDATSGSTQITRQIPAAPVLAPAPVPAQPPGPPQNPLLSSQLWRYIEQEFPDWYGKRATEAATLREDNLDDHAIVRLMDQKMIALRRRYASTALASSQTHLKEIAASFLTMVRELSKHSVSACYGFISHGESAPEVAKLLQNQTYSRHLDAQSLAIVKAVVDGKNLPQTHQPPEPEDYRALAAELTARGWSSNDLQLFTDPVALSNAKPAKVCSMVQDWFAAQLALPNSAAQLRLLVQSLRPVIAG